MAGDRGYAAWRWIFIIEGAITCALAVLAFFTIVDWPEQARFLNDYEKKVLLARLSLDNGAAVMNRFDGAAVKRTFGDIKIWLGYVQFIFYFIFLCLFVIFTSHILQFAYTRRCRRY